MLASVDAVAGDGLGLGEGPPGGGAAPAGAALWAGLGDGVARAGDGEALGLGPGCEPTEQSTLLRSLGQGVGLGDGVGVGVGVADAVAAGVGVESGPAEPAAARCPPTAAAVSAMSMPAAKRRPGMRFSLIRCEGAEVPTQALRRRLRRPHEDKTRPTQHLFRRPLERTPVRSR